MLISTFRPHFRLLARATIPAEVVMLSYNTAATWIIYCTLCYFIQVGVIIVGGHLNNVYRDMAVNITNQLRYRHFMISSTVGYMCKNSQRPKSTDLYYKKLLGWQSVAGYLSITFPNLPLQIMFLWQWIATINVYFESINVKCMLYLVLYSYSYKSKSKVISNLKIPLRNILVTTNKHAISW